MGRSLSVSSVRGSAGSRASAAAPLLCALLASAMLGLLAAVAPVIVILALCSTGLVTIAVVLFRRAPGPVPASTAIHALRGGGTSAVSVGESAARPERDLRGPRILFYLGALTVTETSLHPAFGLTISVICFLAAFAGCVFAVLRGHGVVLVPASLVAGVAIFVLGGAISTAGAYSPLDSGRAVARAVFMTLLLVWTGAMVLKSRRQVLTATTLWAISAAANGTVAITDVLGFHAIAGPSGETRALGLTDHPNSLGGGAAVALVPTLMLATRATMGRTTLNQIARWILVALVAAAIVLSASVAAMLAGLVAMVIWLSSPSVRAPGRVATSMALAAALLVAVLAGGLVPSPTERFGQVTAPASLARPDAGSGQARIDEVKTAWSRIGENPLVGTGLDPAGTGATILFRGAPSIVQVHGAPVAAWYEGGIFGLIGLTVIVAALATAGWRGLAAAGGDDDLVIGWALLAAFAAWLIDFLTNPLYFQEWGWISGIMLFAWAFNCAAVQRPLPPLHAGRVVSRLPST